MIDELEQHADDLVLHEAQPLGAAPALAVLQQQLLGLRAARREHGLEPLRDRAAQLLLGAGVLVGELGELGHERALVEQFGVVVAGLSGVSIWPSG